MSKTTDVNLQQAIDRMASDVVRVRCSKVLLSPEMYSGCLDRITDRYRTIAEFDLLPPATGNVFIRGVPAEKCDALSGTEYALVPKSPENTINGIPLESIPPFRPVVPDEQRPFHHFDTEKLFEALNLHVLDGALPMWLSWGTEEAIAYVVGRMLDATIRKRVLEARVFEQK